MEYKGFFIEKNAKYIVIKNNNGSKLYMSEIYTKDEQKFNEVGKKIIDMGIEIMNTTNKSDYMAFQSIYTLDKNNNIKKYTIDPNGIEIKKKCRKDYKNKMIIHFIIDLVLVSLILLLMDYKNSSDGLIILITFISLILSIVGMLTSLSKKDFHKLDSTGDTFAVGSALVNNKLPSGYGGALITGPAIRYVLPNLIIRIICIITIVSFYKELSLLSFVINLVINILQVIIEIHIYKTIKNYHSINEDGVSDFIAPK